MGKCAGVVHLQAAPHWREVKIRALGTPSGDRAARATPLAKSLGGFASWPDYRPKGLSSAVLTSLGGKEAERLVQSLETKYTCPLGSHGGSGTTATYTFSLSPNFLVRLRALVLNPLYATKWLLHRATTLYMQGPGTPCVSRAIAKTAVCNLTTIRVILGPTEK